MISDYKHYGNRRRPIPWASIIKFIVIVAVLLWMGERDRQHVRDNRALAEVVFTQAQVIDMMECSGVELEMSMPIDRVES